MTGATAITIAVTLLVAWTALVWFVFRQFTRPWITPDPPPTPTTPTVDWCEVCNRPATHELAGGIERTTDEGVSAMTACVACYCAEHAPDGAVAVR